MSEVPNMDFPVFLEKTEDGKTYKVGVFLDDVEVRIGNMKYLYKLSRSEKIQEAEEEKEEYYEESSHVDADGFEPWELDAECTIPDDPAF